MPKSYRDCFHCLARFGGAAAGDTSALLHGFALASTDYGFKRYKGNND